MEISIYNSLKSRLETIDMKFTKKNTTCFGDCKHDNDIYKITDLNEGILIKEFGYSYPIWIDGKTRASISYDQRKGKKI